MEILTIFALIGSACGVFGAIDIFLKWRKQTRENHLPQLPDENRESQVQTTVVETIEDAKLKVSKRLNELLDLINQNQNNKTTISELSEFCGYDKTSDLEKYFLGLEEPSNKEKEKICSDLGINPQWLKHGKGEPFRSQEPYEPYAEAYLETIKHESPKKIFFLRSKNEYGYACIVLRLNKFKYLLFPSTWNISGHVGVTGQKQIYSFYNLIKDLQALKATKYEFQLVSIVGNHIDQIDFDDLTCGRIYPASVIKFHSDNWWDDLTDINHAWQYAPTYKELYGQGFIEAQKIIKYFKNMNRENH